MNRSHCSPWGWLLRASRGCGLSRLLVPLALLLLAEMLVLPAGAQEPVVRVRTSPEVVAVGEPVERSISRRRTSL